MGLVTRKLKKGLSSTIRRRLRRSSSFRLNHILKISTFETISFSRILN